MGLLNRESSADAYRYDDVVIDESAEYARPIDLGLRWLPTANVHLLQSEYRTFLAFHLSARERGSVGVVEWQVCHSAQLGWPNDEALRGHRLWNRGLSQVGAYAAAEVLRSGWIEAMKAGNRVHPHHNADRFLSYRHFICSFQDSTFECVAEGYRVWRSDLAMDDVVETLLPLLDSSKEPPFELVGHS